MLKFLLVVANGLGFRVSCLNLTLTWHVGNLINTKCSTVNIMFAHSLTQKSLKLYQTVCTSDIITELLLTGQQRHFQSDSLCNTF